MKQIVSQSERIFLPKSAIAVARKTENRYAGAMLTHFVRTQVLVRTDIIAQLIWAVKSVRRNLRKTPGE